MTPEQLHDILSQQNKLIEKSINERNPASDSFDENAPFEEVGVDPSYSATEAAITGLGKGASFGYLPQIEAATEPVIQKGIETILGDPQAAQKSAGFKVVDPSTSYLQRRDKQAMAQAQMEKEHPTASLVGELGGALASGISTGGIIPGGSAKSFPSKLVQSSIAGAITGAVRNPGETEGELSPIQTKERLKNMATDAATGAAFQSGASLVGKTGKEMASLARKVKSDAEIRALRASGLMLKDARRIFGFRKANDLGRAALDEGIVSAGDTIDSIAEKAALKKRSLGKELGDIYDQADKLIYGEMKSANQAMEKMPTRGFVLKNEYSQEESIPGLGFYVKGMAKDMWEKVDKKLTGLAGGTASKNKLYAILNDIYQNPEANFSKMKEIRTSIDDMIDYNIQQKEMSSVQKELRYIRTYFQDEVLKGLRMLDAQYKTNMANQFKSLNKRLSNVIELEAIARDKATREASNQTRGLSEKLGGGFGATAGATIAGAPGAIAGWAVGTAGEKLARTYGRPIGAVTTDKVANLLKNNPGKLKEFGEILKKANDISPQRLAIAINLLKGNPNFVKLVEGLDE